MTKDSLESKSGCCDSAPNKAETSTSSRSLPVLTTLDVDKSQTPLKVESAVFDRYAGAAEAVEPSLCCPVDYEGIDLSHIPEEVIAKDYGCGNPAPYIRPGDTVLDLGSGAGKICFAAAKIVGASGQVIGVDCNSEMLALARKHQPDVAQTLGFDNVAFRYGMIQDLQLDFEQAVQSWQGDGLSDPGKLLELKSLEQQLRSDSPMIASESVDCVVSNCVLNLVRREDREQLFAEVFRVLKIGGRAAISDIVCDEPVPKHLQNDPRLWSGCISGAFQEDEFLEAFADAGFVGVTVASFQSEPWQTIEGIEFRSMTVLAQKPSLEECLECHQAVIYRGPFVEASDEFGHLYLRGVRTAVCERTYKMLQGSTFADSFVFIEPHEAIGSADAELFDCSITQIRDAKETKGSRHLTLDGQAESCCDPSGGCC